MPTIFKTNKGYSLTPNNANQVTISDSLYNFIQAQNQNTVTFETINQTYKPRIPLSSNLKINFIVHFTIKQMKKPIFLKVKIKKGNIS